MVEVYVGTSGWMYDWNLGGNFDWYAKHSGLNAVELNASFYRFPFPNQVVSWSRKGKHLRWAVKVHRSITHLRRLNPQALEIAKKFLDLFKPLDPYTDFYLFQLPPSFAKNDTNIERIKFFVRELGLGARFAIEFRHPSWFNEDTVDLCRSLGITVVSIDSPQTTWIVSSNDIVYLRLHGKYVWYAHDYTYEELLELAKAVLELDPRKVYVFFNNDHWMLENARTMLNLLHSLVASMEHR